MSRWEVIGVKSTLSTITAFAFYLLNAINELVIVLVLFMVFDYITGMLRAYITKSINSTLGLAGIIKKVCILIMVVMTASLEFILEQAGQDTRGVALIAVTSFFIVNEGISILENCSQMGAPVPPALYTVLEKLHRDPTGKEQMIQRDPILDKVDKSKLMKENVMIQADNVEEKMLRKNRKKRMKQMKRKAKIDARIKKKEERFNRKNKGL